MVKEQSNLCEHCQTKCGSNSVFCSECSSWFHARCEQLSSKEVRVLSKSDCGYICLCCADNDYATSLARINEAATCFSNLKKVVRRESVIMREAFTLREKLPTVFRRSRDIVSRGLQEKYGLMLERQPLSVSNDGNSLFNAVSLAFSDSQIEAAELRVRTVIEMVVNADKYKGSPNAKPYLTLAPNYEDACLESARKKVSSSVWTMVALSSVIRRPIHSVYPPCNGTKGSNGFIHRTLNTTFLPDKNCGHEPIYIMWTSTMEHRKGLWSPNHFVPLVAMTHVPEIPSEFSAAHVNLLTSSSTNKRDFLDSSNSFELTQSPKRQKLTSVSQNQCLSNLERSSSVTRTGAISSRTNESLKTDIVNAINKESLRTGAIISGTNESLKIGVIISSTNKSLKAGAIISGTNGSLKAGAIISGTNGSLKAGAIISGTNESLNAGAIISGTNESLNAGARISSSNGSLKAGARISSTNGSLKAGARISGTNESLKAGAIISSTNKSLKAGAIISGTNESFKTRAVISSTNKSLKTCAIISHTNESHSDSFVHEVMEPVLVKTKSTTTDKARKEKYEISNTVLKLLQKHARISLSQNIKNPDSQVLSKEHENTEIQHSSDTEYDSDNDIEQTEDHGIAVPSTKESQTYSAQKSVENNGDHQTDQTVLSTEQDGIENLQPMNIYEPYGILADEMLEVFKLVKSHPFVQRINSTRDQGPQIILYLENQIKDFRFFLSQKSEHVVVVNRIFNLGPTFVTYFTYKSLRVLRSETRGHPLFFGPILLHWDASFMTYSYFFSHVRCILGTTIREGQLKVGDGFKTGSDDEKALTKALNMWFSKPERLLRGKQSLNANLKRGTDWKPKKLPELIEILFSEVRLHMCDLRRALIGLGNYHLAPGFGHYRVSIDMWRIKSELKKENLFHEFLLDKKKVKN